MTWTTQGSTSLLLLARAQAGDSDALDQLLQRYLPRLRRWVAGRLPAGHRGLCDTDDLVQDTLINVLRRLPTFEVRHEAALQAYLRRAVWNRLVEELRRGSSQPALEPLDPASVSPGPSPLESAVGAAAIARYEAALARLDEDERCAVIGRIELGCSYPELASMLGKQTPDAARKMVERALPRLAEWMRTDV